MITPFNKIKKIRHMYNRLAWPVNPAEGILFFFYNHDLLFWPASRLFCLLSSSSLQTHRIIWDPAFFLMRMTACQPRTLPSCVNVILTWVLSFQCVRTMLGGQQLFGVWWDMLHSDLMLIILWNNLLGVPSLHDHGCNYVQSCVRTSSLNVC